MELGLIEIVVEPPEIPSLTKDVPTNLTTVESPEAGAAVLIEPPKVPVFENAPEPADLVVLPVRGVPGPAGPQGVGVPGPPGPQGLPGAGSLYFEYNFAVASTLWTIVHNLNSYALTVKTFDGSGDEVDGHVIWISPNEVQVEWYYPTSGLARIFS